MYQLNNGVLYENGKPRFGLGVSYYPSYHPLKCPVAPEDDRVGQLKKDIEDMRRAGFNLVRFAALGDIRRIGAGKDGIQAAFPLIDECMKATVESGIAAQVRLQGYSLNVSGYSGEAMVTPEGRELDIYESFLYASLNHEGLLKDNEDCTYVSAKHFAQYESLVGYQIYNEPNYTCGVDYNPHSIAAWRVWLAEKGILPSDKAATAEPPRHRPVLTLDPVGSEDEDERAWMYWRLFHHEKLSWFISHLGHVAREANPGSENMTCLMAGAPMGEYAAMVGNDFYRTAEGMEVLGITHYSPSYGETIYTASELLDAAESAAAIYGKHVWLVEYNARTNLPGNEWDRETYNAIGSGIKGINYYQWRADYPYAEGPEPDQFGILFHNREKTAAYHHALRMNALLNSPLGEKIVMAEKYRCGVAILYSEKANACCDAMEGSAARITDGMLAAYRTLKKSGVTVDFVRACDLEENKLGIRLLILPTTKHINTEYEMKPRYYYDDEEMALLDAFIQKGGRVMAYCQSGGFQEVRTDGKEYSFQELPDGCGGYRYGLHEVTKNPVTGAYQMHGHLQPQMNAVDALESADISPLFRIADAHDLDCKLLQGEQYYIATLTNFDTRQRPVSAGTELEITIPAQNVSCVRFFTPEEGKNLSFSGKDSLKITLPEVKNGAILLISTGKP